MRRDHRPYVLKRLDIEFQRWYTGHFLRPQFYHLGKAPLFMKPWYVEIFGGPIELGSYANVIATSDKKVRITVWSNAKQEGKIKIGDYCLICPGVRIGAATEITIGNSCMMAQSAYITDSDWHGIYDRSLSIGQSAPVKIGNNVWLGDSVIVGKGVHIGDNSIIGAGSIVVKDIPPDVIAAGNPATVVKNLDPVRHIKTRADWFANARKLAAEFDKIDRLFLKNNTFIGWMRSVMFPRRGD